MSQITGTKGNLSIFDPITSQEVSTAFGVDDTTAEILAEKFAAEAIITEAQLQLKKESKEGEFSPEEYKKLCDDIYEAKLTSDEKYMELMDATFEKMSNLYPDLPPHMRRYTTIDEGADFLNNSDFTGGKDFAEICNTTESGKTTLTDSVLNEQNTRQETTLTPRTESIHEVNDEATLGYLDSINDPTWTHVKGGLQHPNHNDYVLPVSGIHRGRNGKIDTILTMSSHIGQAPSENEKHTERIRAAYSAYSLGASKAIVATNVNGEISTEEISVTDVLGKNKKGEDLTISDYSDVIDASMARKKQLQETGYNPKYAQRKINKKQKTHVPNLAAWCNVPEENAQKAMDILVGAELTDKEKSTILQEMFAQKNPVKEGRLLVFDTETTGFRPSSGGQVLECGVTLTNSDGSVTHMEEKCGIDPRDLKINGTGSQEVHNITPDEVRGKKRFIDTDTKKFIQNHIDNGGIICSHNISFDRSFLRAAGINIPKTQCVDSLYYSDYVEAKGKKDDCSNTLEAFAARNGVNQIAAHTAGDDTRVLHDAIVERIRRQHPRHSMRRDSLSDEGKQCLDFCLRALGV